jgi:gluconokinase
MILLVMGVTGAGKTTIGRLLSQRLGWRFIDGDDFHPAANVEKMKRGISLIDADRWPWLDAIHTELVKCAAKNENVVLACSALKDSYRQRLAAGLDFKCCYLRGTYDEIRSRLESRTGHFATEAILAGQFADLEEPKDAIVVQVTATPEQALQEILRKFNFTGSC